MRKNKSTFLYILLGATFVAYSPATLPPSLAADVGDSAATREASGMIDRWHDAAAHSDFLKYFSYFSKDAVFLGTDGSERWSVDAFAAYAKPHFDQGHGWTLSPKDRHMTLSPDGRTAWFDETVDSPKYGRCRGSGVLVRSEGAWKIAQYNLSVPVPNDLLMQVVRLIESSPAAQRIEDVSVQQAAEMVSKNKGNQNFVILDVRTPQEYASGHLSGSQNVNYSDMTFKDKLAAMDKTKTYLVHCAAGGRSARTVGMMRELGFREAYNMTGGITAWTRAGLSIVP